MQWIQGDPKRLWIVISLWRVSKSQKLAKPNHFWKWYIGRFWYFDVSKVSGVNNLAFHGFANLVGWLEIDSILHGEMNLLLSGSVCWHLFAPDAVLGMNMNMWDCLGVYRYVSMCSRCSGVSLMAHSMRDPVWLETKQPIWQNLERRDCFLLTL